MNNRLNNQLFFFISLFAGILMPFFGFSQEEPKRVTVVVKAVELTPVKEVVQVPATNLPTVISAKKKKSTNVAVVARASNKNSPVRNAAKTTPAKRAADASSVSTAQNPPQTSAQKMSPNDVVAKTPAVPKQNQEKEQLQVSANKEQLERTETDSREPNAQQATKASGLSAETSKAVVQDRSTASNNVVPAQEIQEKYSAKVNAVRYIWIGSFLILAGLVLGLLFGRPAFLVSIAGVVFVIIGFLV